MASPLRFRRSTRRWDAGAVRSELFESLDSALGATAGSPWYRPPPEFDARRFDMANGDTALFAWDADEPMAYWLGNTETPSALWRTDKFEFDSVPFPIARWAQREFLAELLDDEPWLSSYKYLAWFFLPVLSAKDGRSGNRAFFRDHAAGFPDTTRDDALSFYTDLFKTGVFDDVRYLMASKLGTSRDPDQVRMSATMSEFTVAKLLSDVGYDLTPEIEVTTGHSIDFKADRGNESFLIEVTRPLPPTRRSAGSAPAAVRETVHTKTSGQLRAHGGGATLFVDCSSFSDEEWAAVVDARPTLGHRPAVVFRVKPDAPPDRRTMAYAEGAVPVDFPALERPPAQPMSRSDG